MARPRVRITDYFTLESPLATEYRRLFQNLSRSVGEGELKSVLVTSAVTGEGKSTVSSLLAATAAKKGFKTLLMDCDVRRPAIHRLFDLDRHGGLVEVVAEGVSYKNAIKKSALEHLDIVTAGKVTAHPSELFNSKSIDALIQELKFYYDYLVIDSPPVIPVSDPMLLSQSVDGILLVVKTGSTAREVARRAVDIMESNQSRVLGVVLNNAKNSLPYYYDYSHYHYDYSQIGRPGDQAGPVVDVGHEKKSGRDRSGNPDGALMAKDGKRRAH